VDRLYVITQAVKKKELSIKAVPDLFKYVLQQSGQYEESKLSYSFGSKEKGPVIEGEKVDKRIILNTMNSSDWRDRIKTRTTVSDVFLSETEDKSRAWGNIIHLALSLIFTDDDIKPVLKKMVSDSVISEEEKEQLEISLKKVLNHKDAGVFFAPGLDIKMEAELVNADGDFYRPDRIVFKEDETIVIDFKTGKRDEKHAGQLQNYARLLSEMGYVNISKYLIYLSDEVELIRIA